MRTCTKCDISKRETHFYKRKNGLSYMCKDCYSVWRTDHYTKYKDTYIKQRQERKGTIHFRYQQLKSKSKTRGILLTITESQYQEIIQKPCFYCENKLSPPVTDGIGLDRLDSRQGYTIENSVSCCAICNTIKNALLTPEEMKKVASLLISERAL